MLGKPFFVTKERFPQTPSKKVIPDITWQPQRCLCAGDTKIFPNYHGEIADSITN